MSPPLLTFQQATGSELGLVNRFYKANGHKGKCGRDDRVTLARSGDRIVGAVRLIHKGDIWLLRSLWIAGDQRRLGIGGQLLTACLQGLNAPVWCYPYAYLVDFYTAHGFCSALPEQAPAVIARPWQAYRDNGEEFALMVWQPPRSLP
ncbi:GNAT family N-acetyltransferase [Parendozoicomonas haliclonae]|uniref:N-acetyltransferase domain-containing protein n=1 Tax=Parendozoicomonas haliclonae TaxID=1960125 RepID=A0A1X7ANX7_9GAMM|nr:GNAT family N-acetyltransferase [Parendozoicomonas haliclonae]SMA49832.1 hypothetical protein EHSB41UT_03622 [Parendozoicomonas haliclonae]